MLTLPQEKIDELEEVLPDLDVEKAMSYSLADAIREGSSVTEQCIGGWVDGEKVCALSAALMAIKARHIL